MSEEYILADQCDQETLRSKALQVLTGSASIYVITRWDQSLLAVPLDEADEFEMTKMDYEVFVFTEPAPDGSRYEHYHSLYSDEIVHWWRRKGYLLKEGIYQVADRDAKYLALEWVNGKPAEETEMIGQVVHDGKVKELEQYGYVTKGHRDYIENEFCLVEFDYLPPAPEMLIAIGLPGIQVQKSEPINPKVKKPRTRSDAIRTAMNAYMSKCRREGRSFDPDECWRFVADQPSIDTNLDGNLVYPIKGGMETRTLDRENFNARYRSLIVNWF